MACSNKLSNDLLNSCADKPKAGLAHNSKAVLINISDIDRSGSTVADGQITDLVLASGATGYKLEYLKQLASVNSEFAPNAEDVSGFNHNFLGRMMVATQSNIEITAELSNGRFVVVVETPLDAESKYKVFGWENGMDASAITYNVNEASGAIQFTLTTPENAVESYPAMGFYETDEVTSKAAFDALFASI